MLGVPSILHVLGTCLLNNYSFMILVTMDTPSNSHICTVGVRLDQIKYKYNVMDNINRIA